MRQGKGFLTGKELFNVSIKVGNITFMISNYLYSVEVYRNVRIRSIVVQVRSL